jgi:CheY-like chemotaxis protein
MHMGKTVLTIDDSKTVRTVISKHLAPFSVGMLEAENGEQGVECARKGLPDLILLDYNMPVMDGYHTLVELKTDPNLKSIPVVMVTTETSKETVIKLLKLGLNDYIAKPFTRELLLKKINPILKLYEGEDIPPEKSLVAPPPVQAKIVEVTEPEESETFTKISILAVDDKASVLNLLKEYVGDEYDLAAVDGGKAALNAITKKDYSCIFLDLSMPDMSGLEVLDTCLQGRKNEGIEKKIIAMTMKASQQDIRRATELGVQFFLYKPFTKSDVTKLVEQVMEDPGESSSKNLHYVTVRGRTLILDCPGRKSSKYRFYAEFLASSIIEEIDLMTEEGASHIIIKVGEEFLSDAAVLRDFMKLIDRVKELPLTTRLVAESPVTREVLKEYGRTCRIPIDVSVECALGLIAS